MPARPTFDDDDLLKPTLESDLDVRHFGALFRPQSILWPTFLGGPVAGGILFGINYKRMRMPRAALVCWIGSPLLLVALSSVVVLLIQTGVLTSGKSANKSAARFLVIGTSVAIGWLVARHQDRRFTAYSSARLEPRKLLIPALVACITGAIVVEIALEVAGAPQ